MSALASSLLTYPFEKQVLDKPTGKILLWRAWYSSELLDLGDFDVLQEFKSYAQEWVDHDIETICYLPSNPQYSAIFNVLPKQKEASLFQLARSLEALDQSGLLVAVAANDAGGKRLEKWFQYFGLHPQSLSKKKCRIVWARKENIDQEKTDELIKAGSEQKIKLNDQEFFTKPGIFGWHKIDRGSQLLTNYLPNDLSGTGADFGCGYGYLSDHVLKTNKDIKKLYVIDADYNALECARKNLKVFESQTDIDYQWENLTKKPEDLPPLDWIIMNPPFHAGKETDNSVGQRFIHMASESLRPGGILYMVANEHLPYEKTLQKLFSKVEKIDETQGFKIFKAVK